MIVILTDPRVASHLSHAIAEHLRWSRRNGVDAPAELASLLEVLSHDGDSGRLEVTQLGFDAAPVDSRAMSVSDAAAALGVSRRTVERMVADRRLGSFRIGRRVLVPVSAVDELVDGAAS